MEDCTDDHFSALIDEQRRELMAAQSVDSDAEYAFNLQMQEIAASSVASTSVSPQPPVSVDVSAPGGGGNSSTFSLMMEEMERYIQEHNDRKMCKAEFERVREDLDRRLYDQKFATDISSIPEVEWEKYGDNYHKPFYAGSSSSARTHDGFRVYCKGLVREEWIKETKVAAAGIGVAICDFKDNVLFEVKKPLIHAGMVSGFEAELEALISGLDAALTLEMKLVKVFIGDNDIYSCVLGLKQQPTSSKIGELVNQATLLRNKFTSCIFISSIDVNGNGMKSAFKLARDAIVSQIKWPEQTTDGGNHWKETCSICFEDTDISDIFSVDECLHRYCFSCMRKHVEAKLHNAVEVKCPDIGCKNTVKIDSCVKFLDPNLVSIMTHRMKEKSVPPEERVYCPYPRCSALMSRTEVLNYSKASFVGAEHSGARKCIKCEYFFCIECGVPWHYNMSCTDFRRSNTNPAHGDGKLKSLAKVNAWRQCVKCKNMVELAWGCYHITCRCGYEFCYTCGAEWRNKKPTCRCPIWDERNILDRMRHR